MRLYFPYIILVSFILFYGCGSKYAIVSEEYEDKKIVGKTLGVVNLFNYPIIHNPEDIKEDIGEGNPAEVYLLFFKDRIVNELINSGSFKNVNYLNDVDKSSFKITELIISNEQKIIIRLPYSSVNTDTADYNFLLFVDSLVISRKSGITHTNYSPISPIVPNGSERNL